MAGSVTQTAQGIVPSQEDAPSTPPASQGILLRGAEHVSTTTSRLSPFPKLPPPQPSPDLLALRILDAPSKAVYWNAGMSGTVTNYGASCSLSCFRPKVEPGDFSCIAVSLLNDDPSHGQQVIQAGWIRHSTPLGDAPTDTAQLFVYFNTAGGGTGGPADNVRGYNNRQAGWVQLDGTFRPGIDTLPGSHVSGAQYSIDLKFQLSPDKTRWNLRLNGSVIGYYPTSLFTTDQRDPTNPLPLVDTSVTLADHATGVQFYGQVYDSRGGVTTTQMGSGKYPEEGYRRAAFVGKMQFQPKPTSVDTGMEDAGGDSWSRWVDDPVRYDLSVSWRSSSQWNTYMYVGGPGTDGGGWAGWESIGGLFPTTGVDHPSSGVTTLSRKAAVVDLFMVGADQRIYTSWWEDGDWSGYNSGWRLLDWGGEQTFLNDPKVVAVARTPDNIDIFAMGTDYKVYRAYWSAGRDWTGWVNISNKNAFGPGAPPILAAVSRHPGQLDVFVAVPGNIHTSHWTLGVTDWTGKDNAWELLGPPGVIPLQYNILVLSRSPETMDLISFSQNPFSTSGFVCNTWTDGTWSGYLTAGTAPGDGTMTTPRIAGVARGSHIDLFAVGTDSQVWTTSGTPPNWAGIPDEWTKINDPVLTFSNINEIIAVSRKKSCIDVFLAGMDGQVYTASIDEASPDGAAWTSWTSLGGHDFATFNEFGLVACSRNHQTMAVFGRDQTAGKVWVSEWLDPACGPRPFYCLSHDPDHINTDPIEDEIAISLGLSANAIAPDINRTHSGRLVAAHGPLTGGEPGEDDGPEFVDYLQKLHQFALDNPQLALVAFDCKPAVHDPDTGFDILMKIRQHLTHDLPTLNIIISVPHIPDADKLFPQIQHILGPRETVAIDQEDRVTNVAEYFADNHESSHAAHGNGISVNLLQDPIWVPNLRRSIEQGVGMRAGQGAFQSVYVWTMNYPVYQREYIRIGVNGILADFRKNVIDLDNTPGLQSLTTLVTTDPEMRRHVRMATRSDPLRPGPPPAYTLTIETGTNGSAGTDANLTFFVRGELGVAKTTVDASLRGGLPLWTAGRMEAGGTDYVVIYSRDVGELKEVTVYNDMARSVLGNSRWRCERVRVQSALYGVDRVAVFGVDVGSTMVTRELI